MKPVIGGSRPASDETFGFVLAICVAAVLTMAYGCVFLELVGLKGKTFDLTFFLFDVTVVPLVAAATQCIGIRSAKFALMPELAFWVACFLLAALAAVPVAMHLTGSGDAFFRAAALAVVWIAIAVHLIVTALLLFSFGPAARWASLARARFSARAHFVLFALLLTAATISLFRIEPDNRYFNLIFEFFAVRNFDPSSGSIWLALALTCASLFVYLTSLLSRMERNMIVSQDSRYHRISVGATTFMIIFTFVFYFDFALKSDAFHYLTIVGPALHLLHGGHLMVDTYSQYGPGPVLATWIAFQIGTPSVPTANIVIQFLNLSYFATFLVCLGMMSQFRIAAMLLGFCMIGATLAIWAGGDGVISATPGPMGMRYLIPMLAVLAVSLLRDGRHQSPLTLTCAAFGAAWSIEVGVAVLAILTVFLFTVNVHARTFGRLALELLLTLVATFAGVLVLCASIYLSSGRWPDLLPYLQFLRVYNLDSDLWAIETKDFFGWIPMLLAVFVVSTELCLRFVSKKHAVLPVSDHALFYRFVPMTAMAVLAASYYIGRSVDFTIVKAFLPVSAIVIPSILHFASEKNIGRMRLLALIPAIVVVWIISFSSLALFREASPIALLVNECKQMRCSPSALLSRVETSIRNNSSLATVTEPWIKHWSDPQILQETKQLLDQYAAKKDHVETLIGTVQSRNYASDLANLFAGKWYHSARSMTFSDEINPTLSDRIVGSLRKFEQDDIVVVRRDTSQLGPLESRILAEIKASVELCTLATTSEIIVYKASYGACSN